jgi:hypothetical protein
MESCVYEFVCDIDSQTSLFRCVHCGNTQKTADEPTATECQKQKSTTEKS